MTASPRLSRIAGLAAITLVLSFALATCGDQVAMITGGSPPSEEDKLVEELLAKMSLEEKLGQLNLRNWEATAENIGEYRRAVREGRVGGFLNITRNKNFPAPLDELQKIAVEESPNGIPLILGHDVIHGFKTIMPIPLGQAASWDEGLVALGARAAAVEASSAGVNWTFAPMVDISRDPRWGRIAESLGEDVYLASRLGAAMVRGFQGEGLGSPNSLAACPKHYVAYGAAEGGRDYNVAYVPEGLLRDVYLPPFKAALDAGAMTVMSSFNELNGIPATGNHFTLTQVLRDEWGFRGMVVSDWDSVIEMIPAGLARDKVEAAELSLEAGTDFEMNSDSYELHLPRLIKAGRVEMDTVDEAARRILRTKMAMGLFENPYTDTSRAGETLSEPHLEIARQSARASFVLLKNENSVLPVSSDQKVAVIGPLAEVPFQQLGTWIYDGEKKDSRTLLPALRDYLGGEDNINYARGLAYSRSKDKSGFEEAILAAEDSDVILFFGGEESILSGEGHSRGDISLPGAQEELFLMLAELGKPIALIILAGRPISLEGILDRADAVMMAWHPGTMAGPALVDVLYGEHSPSGHLPLSWPKSSGQVPVYYDHKNTGRPPTDSNYTLIDDIDPAEESQHAPGNSSNHLDYGHRPEFPFGHGLSYGSFDYYGLDLDKEVYGMNDTIEVSLRVKNEGQLTAGDVVQLYVRDLFGSVTRPVAQLKAYQTIALPSGGESVVSFSLPVSELGFHNQEMEYVVEPGEFELWVGQDSADKSQLKEFAVR